jgi:hypothetical protein
MRTIIGSKVDVEIRCQGPKLVSEPKLVQLSFAVFPPNRHISPPISGRVSAMPTRDDAATIQLKIRIKEPLRASIEEDAEARGVTMNAVINDRLEQSFREDARSRDLREALALALGANVAAVTLAIGLAIRHVVKWAPLPPNTDLFSDPFIFEQAVAAISTVIESVRPPGDAAVLPGGGDYVATGAEAAAEQWRRLGQDVGAQVCWEIADYPERLGPWGSSIRDWLGPDAIERIRTKVVAFYGTTRGAS